MKLDEKTKLKFAIFVALSAIFLNTLFMDNIIDTNKSNISIILQGDTNLRKTSHNELQKMYLNATPPPDVSPFENTISKAQMLKWTCNIAFGAVIAACGWQLYKNKRSIVHGSKNN